MNGPCLIANLADELLNQVVCFLIIDFESERGHGVQIHRSGTVREDKRLAFPFGERSDLDRYRLVCRRFMNIATPWKFRRFVLRFSREGFQRLNELMNMQLAVHTRFFTYMVRPSYKGNGQTIFSFNFPKIFQSMTDTGKFTSQAGNDF